MLVGTTYYFKFSEGSQLAVGYTSFSIALVTFITILAYRIFQQVRHTKLWEKMPKLNLKKLNLKKLNTKQTEDNLDNPIAIDDVTKSVNLNQLCEPYLEDLLDPTDNYNVV